ncbi:heme oxygenase [Luteibacter sp. Sphag1AF]|uniref:biliverdin-producing heme oxygenase n=1 Tax=Luteibacter sp. Sphag1AF TaxID=2587031 RepID=UPI00160D3B22|nr:heme oxygenase [Luteibacter sp. Sphag1AF]
MPHRLLREQTRDAHDAAEAAPVMRHLLDGTLSRAGYAGLLAAQWVLFRDFERDHAQWLADTVARHGWTWRSRADLLARDVAELGGTLPTEAAVSSRHVVDESASWGMLYVIEGSALGGQLIVRGLRQRFPDAAHRFYGVGDDQGSSWRCFQQILDDVLAEEPAQARAIRGARHMFARFQTTFQDRISHA